MESIESVGGTRTGSYEAGRRIEFLACAEFSDELVVDNFAGGGGASTGMEAALGRPANIAINHSAEAIAMHKVNHPHTRHYQEDVWAVDPTEACGGRKVGVAWFSPDCFPAGTLVLTREGYRPIEQVEVGDEVLTHNSRWRCVTATMSTVRPLLRLRGHGHPGLAVSAEHPFYARRRVDRWNNERRGYDRTLDPAAWVSAGDLGAGWYWATPVSFPCDAVPEVPAYRGRTTAVTPDLLWLAGRYIADGWTRLTETRAELVITCGRHEVDGLRERLGAWGRKGARAGADEMAWHERATGTAYQFTTDHRGLVEWLREHFGHGAAEKLIPGWALGMDPMHRRSLLDGYLSGDGWRGTNTGAPVAECTTVSKALAFGLKALASTLGKTVTMFLRARNGSGVIQGRTVSTLPAWQLRWRDEVDAAHRQTWREGALEWAPIREQVDEGDVAEVFNLSVDEDESYVVEGLVVHNCTHFSRAKGGKPRSKDVRCLADVVIRWAREVKPRCIFLENVEEFQTWGPLDDEGQPIKAREGEDYRAWRAKLVDLGYKVEHRIIVAADHGTPTTRKRFFLVARCDGLPIVWPEATHGKGRAQPWRTAAEVIDWALPCPSIFGRKKSLAEPTLRRIAAGVRRYVIESGAPFIVPLTHHSKTPRVHDIGEPFKTITAAHRGELALVSPTLIQMGYGERDGQSPRVPGIDKPLGTVVAGGAKHALVTAFLAKHFGGVVGHGVERPIGTVTAQDHHALVTAQLELPMMQASFVSKFYGTSTGVSVEEPVPTVTATGQHLAEVRAFLVKYYGAGGSDASQQGLFDPLHTVTTKARFGLVTIHGQQYQITDIGMRMLAPHELFAAQGFPSTYIIDPEFNGKPLTKTAQIRLAGNSVCPQVAEAIVAANVRQRRSIAA